MELLAPLKTWLMSGHPPGQEVLEQAYTSVNDMQTASTQNNEYLFGSSITAADLCRLAPDRLYRGPVQYGTVDRLDVAWF